jgi:hypothetical protein
VDPELGGPEMIGFSERIRRSRFILLAAAYPSLLVCLLASRYFFFLWALFVAENVDRSRPDILFVISDYLLCSFQVLVFPARFIRELKGGGGLWMSPGSISHYHLGDYLGAIWLSSAIWCLAVALFALARRLVFWWRDGG